MPGCERSARISASRAKRSTSSGWRLWRIFRATGEPSTRSMARYTVPIPPAPAWKSSANLPAITMPGRTDIGACSSSISGRLLDVKGSRGEEHRHGSVVGLLDEAIIILVDAVLVAAPGEAAVGLGLIADVVAHPQHLHRAAGRRRPADAGQRGAPRSDTG